MNWSHMPKPGPDVSVPDEKLLELVKQQNRPFATPKDVAAEINITPRQTLKRLDKLAERGVIERAKLSGSAVIYWESDSSSD